MSRELFSKALALVREATGAEGVLVTDLANVRYLTGYTNDTGCLLLLPEQAYLLTDFRFLFQAKQEATECEVLDIAEAGGYAALLGRLVRESGIGTLAFEQENVTFALYSDYRKEISCEMVAMENVLATLRQVKTARELEYLRKAEHIGDLAFAQILGELKPGVTELEIAAKLTYFMQLHGAEGNSFPPIVASGIHSSMPHAMPSEKKLEYGDFVTMDFGCRYKGYCSDMTRTVVLGKADEKQKHIYETVLRAQEMTLQGIRAGMTGREIDAIARNIIYEAGYEGCFGHSTGHSIGLEVHEAPTAGPKSEQVFEDGMLVTVEPGIYVQDFGGVRIEDLVIVRKDGCENLTHSDKKLIEL